MKNIFVFAFIFLVFSICNAGEATEGGIVNSTPSQPVAPQGHTAKQDAPPGGDSNDEPFNIKKVLTRFEFWLSLIVVFFGTVVVFVQYALLRKKDFDGNDILKVFGVTLIIVGTLFLISAGFGDKQIASAMGLFGTLAGYLLGKSSEKNKEKQIEKTKGEE